MSTDKADDKQKVENICEWKRNGTSGKKPQIMKRGCRENIPGSL